MSHQELNQCVKKHKEATTFASLGPVRQNRQWTPYPSHRIETTADWRPLITF